MGDNKGETHPQNQHSRNSPVLSLRTGQLIAPPYPQTGSVGECWAALALPATSGSWGLWVCIKSSAE